MKSRISIAMAVYNGQRYLEDQISSILSQLDQNDEIVVSVDSGKDRSKDILLQVALRDRRIKIYDGPGQGVIRNFENALNHTSGDYIFLSDQDDVWDKEKIDTCLSVFKQKGVLAIVHDAFVTDERLNIISNTFFEKAFCSGVFKNIVRNRYIGCCMAFHKELLSYALPFPKNLPMHDQWLGIVASRYGEVAYIDIQLIYYRRHGNTVTGQKRAGILTKIKWRVHILVNYLRLGAKRK